ncbi:hypothetical protein M8J75_001213 [Diaphorina citri]|nr:hypothetical protein M8J75_001213 [Diaphorina citri]
MSLGTPAKSLSTLDSSTISTGSQIEKSPILFESDEESDDNESYTDTTSSKTEESFKLEVDVRDDKYVKHLRTTLAGIPPPPKFTIPQYSAAEMSDLYKKNSAEFLDFLSYEEKTDDKAINDEMTALQFPDSMKCLYYGIHFNRGQLSVDLESLSDKYRERYVGCETSSTVIDKVKSNTDHLTGSAKKKARKHPWNYSPGRRLSHLARRRQIFTSASMAKSCTGNRSKSSVVDSKRMILKPSSASAAYRSKYSSLSLSQRPSTSSYSQMPTLQPNLPLASTSSSQMPTLKRALFQSPDCFSKESLSKTLPETVSETPRTDKNRARRALFSSGTKKEKTPSKKTPNKKTPKKGGSRRTPHKVTPTSSRKKTPRKSLFADPDDRNHMSSRDLFNVNGKRPRSESLLDLHQSCSGEPAASKITLSHDEKKKLLWVVYHCLKEKKINSKNTLYKPCQNSLYKLCSDEWKAQLAEHSVGGKITNVSEKMLNIARKYVSGVILKVKNNQSFYRSSSSSNLPKLDNSSESGDTSVSHPEIKPPHLYCTDSRSEIGQESTCDERSDLGSKSDVYARSDFDRESICLQSDMEESMCAKSECSLINRITGESSSSYLQDEDTGSGVIGNDRLISEPDDTSSSIRQDSNHSSSRGTGWKPADKADSNSRVSLRSDSRGSRKSDCESVETSSIENQDTNNKSIPIPPVLTLTSPFLKEAQSCKVMLTDMLNEKRLIGELASIYDEETRF